MDYLPKIYNFVLSRELADSVLAWNLKSYKVKQPSSAVLFDHTLALVWHVFALNGAELSVFNKADIAWALCFLKAIDVSQVPSTEDYEKLVEYLRKILITRYSMESEASFAEKNKTMYEKLDDDYPSSSALEDFMSSVQVQEDMALCKSRGTFTATSLKCNDVDLLERLKELNPNIQTLDDVMRMGNP